MALSNSPTGRLPLLARPIRSVRELLETDFATDPDPLNVSRRAWSNEIEPSDQLQTLVCHDMRGGYHDDANPQGAVAKDGNAYAPWFWPLIDIFVYFSHARVTIPPLAWIDTCHRNDVPCLGTLIFEWDAGSNDIKQLLKAPDLCIKQLVSAMMYYGFDGYLLNFECELGTVLTPDQLLDFVSKLATTAHDARPWSKIICYDSIDKEGHLSYQCQLNDANSPFFQVSDGMLIDYHWKPDQSASSVSVAGDRAKQVYMGVDVFGRGTFGGGGYNISSAIRHCFQAGASVAIFAPGWAYEAAGGFSKGREACLRIEARIWTGARYTVIQPAATGWSSEKSPDDGTTFQRSHEVNLLDGAWDGDLLRADVLDSIPPISVFHREGNHVHIEFLSEAGDVVGVVPESPSGKRKAIEGFVGYAPGVRKLLWKERSVVQHDEMPAVWVARPPVADRPPILQAKPIRFELPFMVNFSQGCGKAVYKSGKKVSDTSWYQLLQQDRPALFLFDSALFPDSHNGVCVVWDRTIAFEAGNCVSCEIGAFTNAKVPLFRFYSAAGTCSKIMKISVAVIPGSDTSQQAMGVHFCDRGSVSLMLECNFWKDWLSRFEWLSESQKDAVQELAQNVFPDPHLFEKNLHNIDLGAIAHEFSIWRAGRIFPREIVKTDSEWITFKFQLNASPIASVEWQLTAGSSPSKFHLGQIIIAESWRAPEAVGQLTLEKLHINGSESLLIRWSSWNLNSIAWCDIYLKTCWIGRSFTSAFVVDRALLDKCIDEVKLVVQPVGTNGTPTPLHSAPSISFQNLNGLT